MTHWSCFCPSLPLPFFVSHCLQMKRGEYVVHFMVELCSLPLMLAVFGLISTNWKVWLAKLNGFSWPAEWTTQEELVWRSASLCQISLFVLLSTLLFCVLLCYVIFMKRLYLTHKNEIRMFIQTVWTKIVCRAITIYVFTTITTTTTTYLFIHLFGFIPPPHSHNHITLKWI